MVVNNFFTSAIKYEYLFVCFILNFLLYFLQIIFTNSSKFVPFPEPILNIPLAFFFNNKIINFDTADGDKKSL